MFRVLLKKEIRSLFHSYKSFLCLLIVLGVPHLYARINNDYDRNGWLFVFFTSLTVGQFIYDSLLEDMFEGGFHFISNLHVNFTELFAAKLLVGSVLGVIQLLIIPDPMTASFSLRDIPWLLFIPVISAELAFISCFLTNGAEILSSVCIGLGIIALLILVYLCGCVAAVFIMLTASVLLFPACCRLWTSHWLCCKIK